VRIGQGQVRKKLRRMMKRTQMKKPDFFCDIEFVTVAMVFVFFAFLMTSSHAFVYAIFICLLYIEKF
jgi:hypothetical protein